MDAGISEALKLCVAYPMQLTSTMASGPDTVSRKSPSMPVDVPFIVPAARTVAPITGPNSSCTTPFT